MVLYSATKFLGGHSDLIAGAALAGKPLMKEIKAMRTFMGTMCDPNTGWMLMRSLETLSAWNAPPNLPSSSPTGCSPTR